MLPFLQSSRCYSQAPQTAAPWTAYIGGALLFVFGGGSLLFRLNSNVEYLPLIEGVLLFLAPWVLGFSSVSAMAWTTWVIGVLAVISAGTVLVRGGSPMPP